MARKPRSAPRKHPATGHAGARPTTEGAQARRPAASSEAGNRERVHAAALDLAVERGWHNVSLGDIAERSGLSLGEVHAVAPSRTAIVTGVMAEIDEQSLRGGAPDAEDSPRERLFELLMRRFDALAARRDGIVALTRGCRDEPLTFLCAAPGALRSMSLMLEMAGIASGGLRGMLRAQGLAAITAAAFRVWLRDDSPDMAKTMAAVDKGLARAEDWTRRLHGLRRPASTRAEEGEAPAA